MRFWFRPRPISIVGVVLLVLDALCFRSLIVRALLFFRQLLPSRSEIPVLFHEAYI